MAEANLSSDVCTRLSERILKWEYPPGYRLTEEELCAQFSVSRSPVREALGMLVERGLVDKKARQGYSVRRLDLREINELYDVRLVLELSVIERLCRKGMDEKIIADLERQWTEYRDNLPEMSATAAMADEEFHEILAREADNGVLSRMLGEVDKKIHFVRSADIVNPDRLRATCADHLELLAALRGRDKAVASEVLARNIEWGRTNVEAAIKDALVRAHLSV
jgi:DNA-binding GntR family transcriptional regulator